MTLNWVDQLVNRNVLADLFEDTSLLKPIFVRSVNLSLGPSLKTRADLNGFPDKARPEWLTAKCDRLQANIEFLAVGDLVIDHWRGPGKAHFTFTEEPKRRLRVHIEGEKLRLRFTSSDSLKVSHLSAFSESDTEPQPHYYASPVDRIRLGTSVPEPTERTFYG